MRGCKYMARLIETPLGINKIDVRKLINKMIGDARKNAKPTSCIMCGKTQTSFCNSHSVPQMALRPIADKGIVLHATAVLGVDEEIVDIENGVNKSGTFNYICRECDRTFFQDYENPDTIILKPTDKMLAEIAVKNFLLQLSKRAIEKELMNIQQKEFNAFENLSDGMKIKDIDFAEYKAEVKFHMENANNNQTGGYQILFWDILPYVVPIAMQSAIALKKDLEGVEINNIYEPDPTIRMQYLHLAILPVEGKSVILAFYHKRDKAYRRLRHQINCMQKNDALKYINYLVFAYTENYYISKIKKKELDTNEKLQTLSQENDENPTLGMLGLNNNFGIGYTPVSMDEIPNFLTPVWAV